MVSTFHLLSQLLWLENCQSDATPEPHRVKASLSSAQIKLPVDILGIRMTTMRATTAESAVPEYLDIYKLCKSLVTRRAK